MGDLKKRVIITDYSRWKKLQGLVVSGLTMRAWVSRADLLVTCVGEMTSPDHQEYIRSLPIGVDRIIALPGASPIDALLGSDAMMAELAQGILEGTVSISFFETQAGGSEVELVGRLAFLTGMSPNDIWLHTESCHPSYTSLGSKLTQRQLAQDFGQQHLFLPYLICPKSVDDLCKAIARMRELSGAEQILIRVDGEASCEGQVFWPDLNEVEIIERLAGFAAHSLMIEPAVRHKSLSGLTRIVDGLVRLRALTVQLQSNSWCGNWVHTPFMGSIIGTEVEQSASAISVTMSDLLRRQGVRGRLSNDLLLIEEELPRLGVRPGHVVMTEVNIRETNGSYALEALEQAVEKHGPCSGGMVVLKPLDATLDGFYAMSRRLGSLLYTGHEPFGVMPVVTTSLPSQAFAFLLAPTPKDFNDLLAETWGLMGCQGAAPRIMP